MRSDAIENVGDTGRFVVWPSMLDSIPFALNG